MKKPSSTREKILHVAFDLLWDSSYGSVSVEDICQRAEVHKGSFYHFFRSKSDLAVEAYEEHWKSAQEIYDHIFSVQNPPLERIRLWCQRVREVQAEKAAQYGRVCGCPYASLGAEVATQDEMIRSRTEQLLSRAKKYLESAISDAMREGSVSGTDAGAAAARIHSLCLGMLVQAKVENNLNILLDMEAAVMGMIGAHTVEGAS